MSADRDTVQQAAEVLGRANRPRLTNPTAIETEAESWRWAAEALADAGLLARERYVSLDMLRRGDRLVWTSGGQAEERELHEAASVVADEYHLCWADLNKRCENVNASLLVRRVERGQP